MARTVMDLVSDPRVAKAAAAVVANGFSNWHGIVNG